MISSSPPFAFTSLPHIIFSPPPHSCYIPCPLHPPWLDKSNYALRKVELWSSSLCSFLQPPVTSSLSVQIFSSAPWSQTPSVYVRICSSLNVRDQFSHPYRTTDKIMVLYIPNFTFLENRRFKVINTEEDGWKLATEIDDVQLPSPS
jgi:hypothetical protein